MLLRHPIFPYIIPFGTFLLFTGLTSLTPVSVVWLYPIKTVIVGLLLFMFRRTYTEIKLKVSLLAIVAGLVVFVLWVLPEGRYPTLGQPKEFNPFDKFASHSWSFVWIAFRLIGAVVVVPLMEELFWRSFLLRYLINPDFKQVPIGTFSWLSFCGTVVLFGLEHHQWLPGIVAGIIYTFLLYRKKELFDCILAHAITNLALGIFVLVTQKWVYW
ncbi:CAAX prenyl protease-related protein [Candidatus Poribacteria bacterium]|nr:CAAX prenyl protease-related protein [Candidatus Poribacteria bacterium]